MKKILVIAFRFPPMGGIGERRITKFVKYMTINNVVHVVTVNSKANITPSWLSDLPKDNKNLVIHRLKIRGPFDIINKKHSKLFSARIFYKFHYLLNELLNLIYYIDYAQSWKKEFIPYCVKLIKTEGLNNVFVSGAPFSVVYHSTILKYEFKDRINLVIDFRDPWIVKDYYMSKISVISFLNKKMKKMKKEAISVADYVTTVNPKMIDLVYEEGTPLKKYIEITNGYDEDDLLYCLSDKDFDKFSFIHAGSFTDDGNIPIINFFKALIEVINNEPNIVKDIELTFLSSNPFEYCKNEIPTILKNKCIYIEALSPEKTLLKISSSYVSLVFHGKRKNHAIATKVYETVAIGRPILGIMPEGIGSEFIIANNYGYWSSYDDISSIKESILKFYKLWKTNNKYKIDNANIYKYSYRDLTKSLLKYMI